MARRDLEDRLIPYDARIVKLVAALPNSIIDESLQLHAILSKAVATAIRRVQKAKPLPFALLPFALCLLSFLERLQLMEGALV